MNDLNHILNEFNKMYRMYHSLYNDFARLPLYQNKSTPTSNSLGTKNTFNQPYIGQNYKEKIKSFLFKEI